MKSVPVHTKALISFHLNFQNKIKQLGLFCWPMGICNYKYQQATINMTPSNEQATLKSDKETLIWEVSLVLQLHTTYVQ